MCTILHIETATEVCSVSIASEGKVIACKETEMEHSHAASLFIFIRRLLDTAELTTKNLDAVAVSMGPGSFTGLRIGVSTAKGICYGLDIPMIAIPTLESMCYGMFNRMDTKGFDGKSNYLLVPMIDARRMEVYTAVYNADTEILMDTRALIVEAHTFTKFLENNSMIFFGTGADKLKTVIQHPNAYFDADYKISSLHMIEPAYVRFRKKNFVDTAYFEPYYLKNFQTTTPKKNILF